MKKEEAISLFGGGAKGIAACAEALKITRHAIYQWDEEIPELRALQIKAFLTRPRAARKAMVRCADMV